MTAKTKYLSGESFSNIYATFVEAYADYPIDITYLDEEKFRNRSLKNGIDLNLSAGIYDGPVLVGFVLICTDTFEGEVSAFADTVGIIPEYRGRGHTKGMFEKIIDGMKERGIRKLYLEVLKENKNEINTYKKIGFKPRREFKCMTIDPGSWNSFGVDVNGIDVFKTHSSVLEKFKDLPELNPSWEKSTAAISRIPDPVHYYIASVGDIPAGYLIFYPAINWVMMLRVTELFSNGKVEKALLNKLCSDNKELTKRIRFVNINVEEKYLLKLLADEGFGLYAEHYEMVYETI